METDITGGNNQVGPSNRQFNETNYNFNFIFNITVNDSTSPVHHLREELSISGGLIHHVKDCLQKITAQIDTQARSEEATESQREPATKEPDDFIREKMGEESTDHQLHTALGHTSSTQPQSETVIQSPMDRQMKTGTQERGNSLIYPQIEGLGQHSFDTMMFVPARHGMAHTDSVRIVDLKGQVLEPWDAVFRTSTLSYDYSLYVGDGHVVRFDACSGTVVKERLDMTGPFFKGNVLSYFYRNEFPPEMRVERALGHVRGPYSVSGANDLDFVSWIFTGLSFKQSIQRGYDQPHTDSVRIVDLKGQVLEPGDAVLRTSTLSDDYSLYVGDGHVVRFDACSGTVVKERLDMTGPFFKGNVLSYFYRNEFPPKMRVERALGHVQGPYSVSGWNDLDFVSWIFTGLSFKQNIQSGYYLRRSSP